MKVDRKLLPVMIIVLLVGSVASTAFLDSFEDGDYSDIWKDLSQSSVSPSVTNSYSYDGTYSLYLPSQPGTSTSNRVITSEPLTLDVGDRMSIWLQKVDDDGGENSWLIRLKSSSDSVSIQGSGFYSPAVFFNDRTGSNHDIRSELSKGNWYRAEIERVDPDSIEVTVGGVSKTFSPGSSFLNQDLQFELTGNSWGSGDNLDMAFDRFQIRHSGDGTILESDFDNQNDGSWPFSWQKDTDWSGGPDEFSIDTSNSYSGSGSIYSFNSGEGGSTYVVRAFKNLGFLYEPERISTAIKWDGVEHPGRTTVFFSDTKGQDNSGANEVNNENKVFSVTVDDSGSMSITGLSSSISVSPGNWHRITWKNIDWGAKKMDVYLDGSLKKSGASFSTTNGGINSIMHLNDDQYFYYDEIEMVNIANLPPGTPSDHRPVSVIQDGSPTLGVKVSDPDGDSLTVDFYDSGGNLIGTDSVPSGRWAMTEWGSVSCGSSHSWYVEVSDGSSSTTSSTYSFENDCLPSVDEKNPLNNSVTSKRDVDLEVEANDPDGDTMKTSVYNFSKKNVGNWRSVYSWNRKSQGDLLPEMKNNMSSEPVGTGLMSEHKSSYVRWAEESNDGRLHLVEDLPPNTGRARLDLYFEGDSFQDSGAAFWAEDASGNRYVFQCNSGLSGVSLGCGTDQDSFQWKNTYTVSSPSRLTELHFMVDMENSLGNWYDEARLYRVNLEIDAGELLGSKTGMTSGDRTNFQWNNLKDGDHWWYATSTDEHGFLNWEKPWVFTVSNSDPYKPKNPDPPDGALLKSTGSVKISAVYSDPEGDPGELTFYNADTNDKVVTSGGSATCSVSNNNRCGVTWTNITRGEDHSWYAVASDSPGSATKSDTWSFHVNKKPVMTDISPPDGSVWTSGEIVLNATATDKESSKVTAFFFDSNGNLLGKEKGPTGTVLASDKWKNLKIGETYRWELNLSDGFENRTLGMFDFLRSASRSYRTSHRIKYQYTSIITYMEGSEALRLRVINSVPVKKQLVTYLTGVNAIFSENGKSKISYTLGKRDSRTFRLQVNPEKTGDRRLKIKTENVDIQTNTTASIPVLVRENPGNYRSRNVPGIGILQLISILVVSSLYLYYSRP